MGSEYRHEFTESLDAVARSVRHIEDVSDPHLRDAIRTALGLQGEQPGLAAVRRARIRRIVLAAATPHRPRLSDRAVGVFTVLAAPAPYAIRFLAAVTLSLGLLAGATVASADSLPDDALYPVKLAAEQLRLALAVAPEHRASVELSLAEHRLGEAERLAARGSESGALIATSAYAAHLASAAAELSQVEARSPRAAALLAQLESRLALQRTRSADTAQRLLADPQTALAGAVLRTIAATSHGSGATAASRIADGAASVSARLSAVADDRARSGPVADDEDDGSVRERPELPLLPAPRTAPTAAAATAGTRELQAATPHSTPSSAVRSTTRPTPDPSTRVTAEKAREAATKAKLAADRAKTTPTPMPTKTPRR